jgi:glutamine synthetase
MCEVLNPDMTPHVTNTRAHAVDVAKKYAAFEPMFGIEQEYTFFQDGRPYGWPEDGFPAPQGPYYCGVGGAKMPGRDIVEAHTLACMQAGIGIEGTNAEVMMGQWEFQVGILDPVAVGDQLWTARWLLERIAEEFGVDVSFDAKPIKGDWNGAGAHTNFSTKQMRAPGGFAAIVAGAEALGTKVKEHIAIYGVGIEDRLTGAHETAPYNKFSYGVSNRGASVRIPAAVATAQRGYLEDRRPNANADPYQVAALITETICGAADEVRVPVKKAAAKKVVDDHPLRLPGVVGPATGSVQLRAGPRRLRHPAIDERASPVTGKRRLCHKTVSSTRRQSPAHPAHPPRTAQPCEGDSRGEIGRGEDAHRARCGFTDRSTAHPDQPHHVSRAGEAQTVTVDDKDQARQ